MKPGWTVLTIIFGGKEIEVGDRCKKVVGAVVFFQQRGQFSFSRLVVGSVEDRLNCVPSISICREYIAVDIVVARYNVDAAPSAANSTCKLFKPSHSYVIFLLHAFEGNVSCDKDGVNIADVGCSASRIVDKFLSEIKLRILVCLAQRVFQMDVRDMKQKHNKTAYEGYGLTHQLLKSEGES